MRDGEATNDQVVEAAVARLCALSAGFEVVVVEPLSLLGLIAGLRASCVEVGKGAGEDIAQLALQVALGKTLRNLQRPCSAFSLRDTPRC